MKRWVVVMILIVGAAVQGKAQQVESIAFHLYTDSLKKGVYNYINVDGKLSNGNWRPLNSQTIQFSSNAGKWDGNNLIIDSGYTKDSVVVTAVVKSNTALKQTITIYMKKNLREPELKTEEELLEEMNNNSRRGRQRRNGH